MPLRLTSGWRRRRVRAMWIIRFATSCLGFGQPSFRVYAASDRVFIFRAVEAEIEFELDDAGEVARAATRRTTGKQRSSYQGA